MQMLLNGLISGFAIALLAAGFQLVYLPSRVFFLALGGMFAVAPYVALATHQILPYWSLSVLVALGAIVALAVSCELFNHSPLRRKGASEGAHLISSLGISIVLVQAAAMIWGNGSFVLRRAAETPIYLGDVVLTPSQLLMAGVSALLLLSFVVTLHTTGLGLRLRALADDDKQFARYGYDPRVYRLVGFSVAGLFVGSASLVTAYDVGFDLYGGLHALLLAVAAVIIGGRTSFIGPIIGGVLLGLVREQVAWSLSPLWQDAITFLLLAAFLLFRPVGILGRNARLETVAA